jgi:hypothetical protein
MEDGISVFEWDKPEVIPPNQLKQNPETVISDSGMTSNL